jgi:hypothetical protein
MSRKNSENKTEKSYPRAFFAILGKTGLFSRGLKERACLVILEIWDFSSILVV